MASIYQLSMLYWPVRPQADGFEHDGCMTGARLCVSFKSLG